MSNDNTRTGSDEGYRGYDTPGQDKILQSSSSAVPSPSSTSEQRIETPDQNIQSIGESAGDANPAMAETIAHEQGEVSTADFLLAREAAEEQPVRQGGGATTQDQVEGLRPDEYADTDSGRPNWPNDRKEAPVDYMDSPRANAPLGSGSSDKFDLTIKPRMDAAVDRAGTEASKGESRSGLPHVGFNAEEDEYEEREFGRPTEPSEIETIAPKMVNLPDDDA